MTKSQKQMSSFVAITFSLSFLCWYVSLQLDDLVLGVELSPLLVQLGNFMPSIVGLLFIITTYKKGRKKPNKSFSIISAMIS